MQLARKQKNRIATAAFESLESRQMMSATVTPSGGDDTAAIQNAINNAPAGQTVNLGAGTFHVSSALNVNGHVLAGVSGQTTLDWTGSSGGAMINSGSNSEVENLTLNGAGVSLTDSSSNVVITHDTLENISSTGINGQGGCDNLQITNNTLQNIGGYGMVLYSINQAHVDNNTITNAYEGIHSVNFLGTAAGNNCTFNYNTITGISRIAIEVQNNWDNLSIGWNYVADFNVQPGGNSHIALSIATGPGTGGAIAENVDVHDNVLLGTGPGIPSDPNYLFTAIEIMGDHSIVNHNFIANWGWSVLDGWTSNWQVTNNVCVDVYSMGGKDALPENQGVAPSVDSGNVYTMGWNGQVPSVFADAGVNGAATAAPVVAAPTSLAATSPNSGEIDLSWQASTTANATYTIEMKSTYGSDPYVTVATLPAGATSYAITGLNPNWVYNITVTATANGQTSSAAFVQDQVQPPPAVSTTPIVSTAPTSGEGTGTGTTGGGSTTGKTSSGSTGSTGSSSSGSTGKTKTTSSGSKTTVSSPPTSTTTTKKKTATKTTKTKKTVSSTPPVAVAAAPGHGLQATFTKGRGKKKAVASEVTANVDYSLNGKSKTVPALTSPVGKSNYQVVWTGEVEAPTSGTYRLSAGSSDDMRVWIDGKEVVSDSSLSPITGSSGAIKLVAGEQYDIKVEYSRKSGATAQLMWATKSMARQVIPDEDLYLPQAA